MKKLYTSIAILLFVLGARAQCTLQASIRNRDDGKPIPDVSVAIAYTSQGGMSDSMGFVSIIGITPGKQVVHFQCMGFNPVVDSFTFPHTDTLRIFLEPESEELGNISITTTRSSRTIQDIPTRVEVITGDELAEKANMKPGDIKMMLSESTGIQTLQTSPISGNTNIRIEGLDGRYTQILKDGFPLFAGFSGGLGLMQTPPLDLKQVEIIKGASSTLYGGGAIAGLINLISKTPKPERELRFLINGTSAGGLDINGFFAQRFGKVGVTLYAAYNSNAPYAPDNTVFTAIPKFNRYTFNPKLFFYPSPNTELMIGVNTSFETRLGGDIYFLKGQVDSVHSYFEDNESQRISSELELKHTFANGGKVTLKNSIDHFQRLINSPGYSFDGTQTSTFSEMSYFRKRKNLEWTLGANLVTDQFYEIKQPDIPYRDYIISTAGVFIQNIWDINKKLVIESCLRVDQVINFGNAVLPRLSILYKQGSGFSSRLGGGLGYKTPTIFTEESERINYRDVLPAFQGKNVLERSYGANWDANYKTYFTKSRIAFSINQLFFFTRLDNPLVLTYLGSGLSQFQNLTAHIEAKGAETNVKLSRGHFKLFLGYTYTHSHIHQNGNFYETPLTPRHHTNSVLMYEVENKCRIGIEGYYYSPQTLTDGSHGRDYWLCGAMAEKMWKKYSVYINFENILDIRQTRYGAIYTGPINAPRFVDIYAPLDGFIANGGIKVKL